MKITLPNLDNLKEVKVITTLAVQSWVFKEPIVVLSKRLIEEPPHEYCD
jgi:hypothetical protein